MIDENRTSNGFAAERNSHVYLKARSVATLTGETRPAKKTI